ncbi:MAG: CHASE2 domain-containing protein [Cyanobacteria bacterium P01_D01_bin.156]
MEDQSRWEKSLERLKTGLWGLGIVASVIGARSLGAFQVVELMALDRLLATQLSFQTGDKPITIVGIDSLSTEETNDTDETIDTIDAAELTEILENIFENEPAVVGIDILSHRITGDLDKTLLPLIRRNSNLILVERILSNPVEPLPKLSQTQLNQQVGFNDLSLDRDGTVRRALLGSYNTDDEFETSFAIQIIQSYFKSERFSNQDLELENGIQDELAMRFGPVEIPRIKSAYGYVNNDESDIQALINYRGQVKPFNLIGRTDLLTSQRQEDERIKDKIVIVSLVDPLQGNQIPLTVFNRVVNNKQLASGAEIQAYTISQIIKAVEKQQPLLWTSGIAQLIFLISFSILSIIASRFSQGVISGFVRLSLIAGSSIVVSYILLLQVGLWLPLAVTLVSITANGLIYINYAQNERRWAKLIEQRNLALEKERHVSEKLAFARQKTIENVFDSIHNGPLQTLANLLRRTRDETINIPDICLGLEDLNREIRYIGDSIKEDVVARKNSLDVSYAGTKFDLDIPLHELFQEVYDAMLSRPLLGFSSLKFTIISFDPLESDILNVEVKRKLCRFVEEALGNVGKHAVGATQLVVTGKHKDEHYEITVADNGPGVDMHEAGSGEGTRIGQEIEKLTKGTFVRRPNKPKGFFCQLTFPLST